MARLLAFPARPTKLAVVPAARSCFDACPIPVEVQIAMGLSGGLVLFGGPKPAKQIGTQECRPMLKEA